MKSAILRPSNGQVESDLAVQASGESHGAWTLSTLDNGVISKEHWTTVDAADDLSWAIFHYSGAAAGRHGTTRRPDSGRAGHLRLQAPSRLCTAASRAGLRPLGPRSAALGPLRGAAQNADFAASGPQAVVGQSYLGGLLCSADGAWPEAARSGPEYARIRAAFAKCGIELWELYGHGPPGEGTSFMWTAEHAAWERSNPPPLEPIGDQTVQAWRKSEKEKLLAGI